MPLRPPATRTRLQPGTPRLPTVRLPPVPAPPLVAAVRTAVDVAAGFVAWLAFAVVIGVTWGAFIHHGNPTDETAAADWHEWEDEMSGQ